MKTFLAIVASLIGVAAVIFVGTGIIASMSNEETYARSVGLSMSECVQVMHGMGAWGDEADRQCERSIEKNPYHIRRHAQYSVRP